MFRSVKASRTSLACTLALACLTAAALPFVPQASAQQEEATPKKHAAKDDASSQGAQPTGQAEKENAKPVAQDKLTHPVLWHQPEKIGSLDLYYGQGGKTHQPKAPFTFQDEDLNGTNPKMDVRDADGKKWRVKTGAEARPEVTASRLMWAMGFYANDDYFVPQSTVSGVSMKRGDADMKSGNVKDARYARKPSGQDKIGIWEWKANPFSNTREFNGLRVMMAVMNNWDLKDVNNAVYTDKATGQQLFLVSDIGASFGSNGIGFSKNSSKGNVKNFEKSGFVKKLTDTSVDFSTPKKPTAVLYTTGGFSLKSYSMRKELDWIGQDVPRGDARWMGSLLAQLSHAQLVDAFRAGGFSQDEIEAYVQLIESRIAELQKL